MRLKYALLISKSGVPIVSIDFADGLNVNEVLFSGFIGAIQPFMSDMVRDRTSQKTGEIKTGDLEIKFYKGQRFIGVLVGTEIDSSLLLRFGHHVDEFEAQTEKYDLSTLLSDDSAIQSSIELFKTRVYNEFHVEGIHKYLIPKKVEDNHFPKLENLNRSNVVDNMKNFLSLIDGTRTLGDISEELSIPWESFTSLVVELLRMRYILLRESYNDEFIFKITSRGMKALFSKDELHFIPHWQSLAVPFLGELDGEKTLREIKENLKKAIKKHSLDDFEYVLRELLFAQMIEPLQDVYVLGKFLQLVYLNFYQGVKKKTGNMGVKLLLEKISEIPHLVPLLPNFEKNEFKPLDRIAHVFLPMTMEERKDTIKQFLKPVNDTLSTLQSFAGEKSIRKIRDGLYKNLLHEYPALVKRYEIERIFRELETSVNQ